MWDGRATAREVGGDVHGARMGDGSGGIQGPVQTDVDVGVSLLRLPRWMGGK